MRRRARYLSVEELNHEAHLSVHQQAADAAYDQMITNSQKPPPAPKSTRRDCYDQGDGMEKCFYD